MSDLVPRVRRDHLSEVVKELSGASAVNEFPVVSPANIMETMSTRFSLAHGQKDLIRSFGVVY